MSLLSEIEGFKKAKKLAKQLEKQHIQKVLVQAKAKHNQGIAESDLDHAEYQKWLEHTWKYGRNWSRNRICLSALGQAVKYSQYSNERIRYK